MSADTDGHEDLRLDGSVTVVGIVGLLGLVGSRIAQLVVVRGGASSVCLVRFTTQTGLPRHSTRMSWLVPTY